jgi:hypothetical protein
MGGQELVEKGSPNRGLLLQTGWGAPLTPAQRDVSKDPTHTSNTPKKCQIARFARAKHTSHKAGAYQSISQLLGTSCQPAIGP